MVIWTVLVVLAILTLVGVLPGAVLAWAVIISLILVILNAAING